ncbi:MAG: Ig-like domain-containing protein [Oscillospiraceae bacterium]|nr:Ig-like domain-containing protein [Oscillospiraceae bacterium]
MKIKKIAAVLLAFIFAVNLAAVPVSANGTILIVPLETSVTTITTYEYKISGICTLAGNGTDLFAGDSLTLSNVLVNNTYNAAAPVLNSENVKTVRQATLTAIYNDDGYLYERSTSLTRSTVNISAISTANTLPPSFTANNNYTVINDHKVIAFKWSAIITLADTGKKLDGASVTYTTIDNKAPQITIGNTATDFKNWTAELVEIESKTSPSVPLNINLNCNEYLKDEKAADKKEIAKEKAEALRDSVSFNIIINFDRAAAGTEKFSFSTELSAGKSVDGTASKDMRSLTLQNVPKSYFFDTAFYNNDAKNLLDACMFWLKLSGTSLGSLSVSSIEINYFNRTPGGNDNNNNNNNNNSGNNNNNSNNNSGSDDPSIPELLLNFRAITLAVGAEMVYLKADGYDYKDLRFSVASPHKNQDIITVYNTGRIVANKTTKTDEVIIINVREPKTGASAQCRVTVVAKPTRPITSFEFSNAGGVVYVGGSYNLMAGSNVTINPSNYNDAINWYSSDTSIAAVDNGRVRVVGTGVVVITAVTRSGIHRTRTLTARFPEIDLASTSATINTGGTVTIKATPKPSTGRLTYASLNESIATVNPDGVVTGVERGTARIRISINSGGVITDRIFTVIVR